MASVATSYLASAEHDPLLLKHIPLAKIPAVLRLLDHSNDVLELSDVGYCELLGYFHVAEIARKNAFGNRQSTDTLSTFRSSGASSIFSAQRESQASLASDVTHLSATSAASARPSQHSSLRTCLPLHTSDISLSSTTPVQSRTRNESSKEKRYKCPSCAGTGATRRSDLLKHLKGFCEKQDLGIPPKVAYGCPYCGSLHSCLKDYSSCICKDQELNPLLSPRPLLRLRGLLQQDIVKETLTSQCRKRGLDPDAWRSLTWEEASIAEFAERLEYGCNASDVRHGLTVDNVEDFVREVLDAAKFELSGKPVPPVKDGVEAHTRALLRDKAGGVAAASMLSNQQPMRALDPLMSDYLRLRSSDPSLSETRQGIQQLTATALQGSQVAESDEYPLWKQIQQKRPPSTSSSSLADSRSRSKRPAATIEMDTDVEVTSSTHFVPGGDDFFSQSMDPAMCTMRSAFSECGPYWLTE